MSVLVRVCVNGLVLGGLVDEIMDLWMETFPCRLVAL